MKWLTCDNGGLLSCSFYLLYALLFFYYFTCVAAVKLITLDMGSTVKDIAQTMPDKGVYDCWGSYIHDGYLLMPDCTPRVMNWLKNEMQFDEGDVVLSSFPMSGE